MKHVRLIATGGTIASRVEAEGGPVNATLAGERLIAGLHEPPRDVRCSVENFAAAGSYALDLATVHRLCQRIDVILADPAVDGVVVTHGTDTMEESAFLAWLLVASDKPVVFTGAQRHAGVPDSDGPRNIADAIRTAACPDAAGMGALVLFEGDIHAAREVSKQHSARVDTFRSAGFGKLGEVDNGCVYFYRRPAVPRQVFVVPRLDPDVEVMLLGLGSTPRFLEWAGTSGVSGVVLAAFGRGNAPGGFAAAVARLVSGGVPVVVATRCAEGRTHPVYGGDSGGRTLESEGVIFGGTLSAVKARLLLSALLGKGLRPDEIRDRFPAYV